MFKYISSIFLNVFTLNELCELSTNINETTGTGERTKVSLLRRRNKTENLPNNDRYKVLEINYLRHEQEKATHPNMKIRNFYLLQNQKLHKRTPDDAKCLIFLSGVGDERRICVVGRVVSNDKLLCCLSCEEIRSFLVFRLPLPPLHRSFKRVQRFMLRNVL